VLGPGQGPAHRAYCAPYRNTTPFGDPNPLPTRKRSWHWGTIYLPDRGYGSRTGYRIQLFYQKYMPDLPCSESQQSISRRHVWHNQMHDQFLPWIWSCTTGLPRSLLHQMPLAFYGRPLFPHQYWQGEDESL